MGVITGLKCAKKHPKKNYYCDRELKHKGKHRAYALNGKLLSGWKGR